MNKHLLEIGQGVPRDALRPHIKRIEEGEMPSYEKRDYMALTALYIKEAWTPMYEWIHKHDQGLPIHPNRTTGDFSIAPSDYYRQEKFAEDIIEDIKSKVQAFCLTGITRWLATKSSDNNPQYKHFTTLVSLDNKVNNAGEHIFSGLNTATNAILNIFKVIPAIYRDTYHPTIISSAEARSIAHDSKKLIVVMASMGISGLVQLEEHLSLNGDRSNYHFSHFTLDEKTVGTQKKLILGVKPEDIRKIKATVHEQEIVTGCPALAIDGPSGQNIVHEFYDWLYAIADQHYFPFFDDLKKRAGH